MLCVKSFSLHALLWPLSHLHCYMQPDALLWSVVCPTHDVTAADPVRDCSLDEPPRLLHSTSSTSSHAPAARRHCSSDAPGRTHCPTAGSPTA